jgi:chromosome segregation ATPase
MEIKDAIERCATARIRSVAKSDAIYDRAGEAKGAEDAMAKANKAKDPKAFEKAKKDCLTSVAEGEKAIKPWQKEMDDWDNYIKELQNAIAAEKDKLAQLQKEDDAVSKAIDDINKEIQAYNDSLLLGKHDPRYRPLVGKKSSAAKLKAVADVIADASKHAEDERNTWQKQNGWVGKPIDELQDIKARASKAKFSPGK